MDKVAKAMAVSLVLFSIVLAGFVGSRVDQITIALLGGTFIGLLVAIPSSLLVMVLMTRRRDDDRYERPQRYTSQPSHLPPSPPQYWVMPNQTQQAYDVRVSQTPASPPQVQAPIVAPEYMLPMNRRRFYMIGEGGEVKEIEAPQEAYGSQSGDPFADAGDARF